MVYYLLKKNMAIVFLPCQREKQAAAMLWSFLLTSLSSAISKKNKQNKKSQCEIHMRTIEQRALNS